VEAQGNSSCHWRSGENRSCDFFVRVNRGIDVLILWTRSIGAVLCLGNFEMADFLEVFVCVVLHVSTADCESFRFCWSPFSSYKRGGEMVVQKRWCLIVSQEQCNGYTTYFTA
jgi:hypothetical protein